MTIMYEKGIMEMTKIGAGFYPGLDPQLGDI